MLTQCLLTCAESVELTHYLLVLCGVETHSENLGQVNRPPGQQHDYDYVAYEGGVDLRDVDLLAQEHDAKEVDDESKDLTDTNYLVHTGECSVDVEEF